MTIELLRDHTASDVRIEALNGDLARLVEWLEQANCAWLIDAAAGGDAPGTVWRFDVADGGLPERMFSLSTHGFGLAETLELVRALGALPERCIVYSIEGGTFEDGAAVSAAVRAAAHSVADKILNEIREFSTERV